jgi:hypothetical protein
MSSFKFILKKTYHVVTGISEGRANPNFVPFRQRNPTPDQIADRNRYLREKYLWKGRNGWGAGGDGKVFATEAAALDEAERLETEMERMV